MDGLDQVLRALAIAAALVVAVGTPVSIWIARRLDVVARPGGRSQHEGDIPLLAGLGMLAAILVAVLFTLPEIPPEYGAILGGATMISLLGAVDDAISLPPLVKLVGQALCAVPPMAAGVTIDRVTLPPLPPFDLGLLQYPLTMLFIVAVANIVNLADGMDGLAGGLCAISSGTFAILALSLGRVDSAVLAAAVCGACLGFLPWNFHPAKVFMGDSGSLMLGYLLATISITGVMKTAAALALVFPLALLAVPILDTSFVIAKRLRAGRSIMEPDRSHFHHRLLRIGYSQRQAAVMLYAWCAIMAAFAVSVRFLPPRPRGQWNVGNVVVLGAFGLAALAVSLYVVYALELLKYGHLRKLGFMRGSDPPDERPLVAERRRRREQMTWP